MERDNRDVKKKKEEVEKGIKRNTVKREVEWGIKGTKKGRENGRGGKADKRNAK